MRVLVIVVALLASAVASHLHSAHMQWQAKQEEASYNKPSDVPKLAEREYDMGNAESQDVMQSDKEHGSVKDKAKMVNDEAPHLQSEHVHRQAKQQEEANYNKPSEVPKLAQDEGMGDAENQDTMPSDGEQMMEHFTKDEVKKENVHKQREQDEGEQDLENQSQNENPSDTQKSAHHEYYSMEDAESQDMEQNDEEEEAMEQFAEDKVQAVDDGANDEPSTKQEEFAEMESVEFDEFGFLRVYSLDMTKSGQECPDKLMPKKYGSLRLCGKRLNGNGCSSITIPVKGRRYNEVRGKVVAYQYASPDAFNTGTDDINSAYVDGISITYGKPNKRKHVWTLAVSLFPYARSSVTCPGSGFGHPQPSFVGYNYFCGSGNVEPNKWAHIFYNVPLWSEVKGNCGHCNKAEDVPFFCTKLPESTTEDLEFRICANQVLSDEDIQVQSIELHIK